jgi:hypothetical protein
MVGREVVVQAIYLGTKQHFPFMTRFQLFLLSALCLAARSVMHAVMSLIMVGREDIVETMNIINLDTMRPDPEGSQVVVSQAATSARRLRLTAQQQNIIATGTELYMGLLQTVVQERQQLQTQFSDPALWAQQQQQQAPGQGPAVSSGGSNNTDISVPDSFNSRHAHLEAEEQRMARLQLLMQKE